MPFAQSETPEHVRSTLGALLRRHRELRERSLHDVAGPAGISPAFLSEVERGRKEMSVEKLLAVAGALEVTLAGLYLELARALGADPVERPPEMVLEADARAQVRRMSESLNPDALRAVARFTTFLAMTEPAPRKRPIGFTR